jgi:hypothetical protein
MNGPLEPVNGDGSMRVTLGEVNRNILALRGDFQKWTERHEDGHETNARWMVTSIISIGGMVVAIIAAVARHS